MSLECSYFRGMQMIESVVTTDHVHDRGGFPDHET